MKLNYLNDILITYVCLALKKPWIWMVSQSHSIIIWMEAYIQARTITPVHTEKNYINGVKCHASEAYMGGIVVRTIRKKYFTFM